MLDPKASIPTCPQCFAPWGSFRSLPHLRSAVEGWGGSSGVLHTRF